jgi:hypothetical protein
MESADDGIIEDLYLEQESMDIPEIVLLRLRLNSTMGDIMLHAQVC